MKEIKFNITEIIHHKLFNYTGIIVDVDFEYSGTDEWYEQVAKSKPAKDQPWYKVLVHNTEHQTYVAEQNITASPDQKTRVNNPLIPYYYSISENGNYQLKLKKN